MKQPFRLTLPAAALFGITALLLGPLGCTKHEVEVKPIKIEPIHMTIDVNVKVQRELDDFFAFEDDIESSAK